MKSLSQITLVALLLFKGCANASSDCELHFGGRLVDYKVRSPTNLQQGGAMSVCKIKVGDSLAALSASATESGLPTIAATLLRQLGPINVSAAVEGHTSFNPAGPICSSLGGVDAGATPLSSNDGEGEIDLCFFPDGSACSAWTLLYTSLSDLHGHTDFQSIRSSIRDSQLLLGATVTRNRFVFQELDTITACERDDDCGSVSVCGMSSTVCGSHGYCIPARSTCDIDCKGYSLPVAGVSGKQYCVSTSCQENICVPDL